MFVFINSSAESLAHQSFVTQAGAEWHNKFSSTLTKAKAKILLSAPINLRYIMATIHVYVCVCMCVNNVTRGGISPVLRLEVGFIALVAHDAHTDEQNEDDNDKQSHDRGGHNDPHGVVLVRSNAQSGRDGSRSVIDLAL